MGQVDITRSYLDVFGQSSGQKVSREKIKIFFSQNVHHSRTTKIVEAFGFQVTGDLGKYLGVPLQHKRTSSKSFSYVTDKLFQHHSWKANALSLVGCLTLCSLVISSILLYPMQIAYLPQPVSQNIDSACGFFLWGDIGHKRKMHLCK